MPTLFSRIIKGEIPCYKIAEDERYFAFLDINPLAEGHTLIVPKEETDYLFDMEDDALAGMSVFAKRIALAIGKAVPCKRVGIAVLGLEVPHAHIHLIPINNLGDIDFSKPKLKFAPEKFIATADKIKARLQEPA
jgi:histidine triad (HIT) family protein